MHSLGAVNVQGKSQACLWYSFQVNQPNQEALEQVDQAATCMLLVACGYHLNSTYSRAGGKLGKTLLAQKNWFGFRPGSPWSTPAILLAYACGEEVSRVGWKIRNSIQPVLLHDPLLKSEPSHPAFDRFPLLPSDSFKYCICESQPVLENHIM